MIVLIVQNIPLHALALILTVCQPKDLAGNAKNLLVVSLQCIVIAVD